MDLTHENLIRLLGWLDPDPEAAGQEYVRIRADLAKKFTSQRCQSPDKLADITMDRVAEILTPETITNWRGQKIKYFYRVAYYVMLELCHNLPEVELSDDLVVVARDTYGDSDKEREFVCLDKCLGELTDDKRELITKYYRGKKAVKIKNRKALAKKLKLTLALLRVQALRIRKGLKICIRACLKESEAS